MELYVRVSPLAHAPEAPNQLPLTVDLKSEMLKFLAAAWFEPFPIHTCPFDKLDPATALNLLLNVVQSVEDKAPVAEELAVAMLITGVVPPVATLMGAVPVTFVTVPAAAVVHDALVPSVDKTLPAFDACVGKNAFNAPAAVV